MLLSARMIYVVFTGPSLGTHYLFSSYLVYLTKHAQLDPVRLGALNPLILPMLVRPI